MAASAGPLELYADVLWNTALLPDEIVVGGVTYEKSAPGGFTLAASINGQVVFGNVSNPIDAPGMITRINETITYYCYGGEDNVVVFDCLTTTIPYPSRFVIMNGTVPRFTQTQQADQLIMTAFNAYTYLGTDWRSPPAYLPGPIAP